MSELKHFSASHVKVLAVALDQHLSVHKDFACFHIRIDLIHSCLRTCLSSLHYISPVVAETQTCNFAGDIFPLNDIDATDRT